MVETSVERKSEKETMVITTHTYFYTCKTNIASCAHNPYFRTVLFLYSKRFKIYFLFQVYLYETCFGCLLICFKKH